VVAAAARWATTPVDTDCGSVIRACWLTGRTSTMHRRTRDTEHTGSIPDWQVSRPRNIDCRESTSRPTESFPLRSGPLEARQDPFSDAFPFELRDSAEDVHLQLAGGGGRVGQSA
jgi:hypothetical protein